MSFDSVDFRPCYKMGLILDCYIRLQRAKTLICSFLVVTETPVLAWDFCCRCRGAGLIERLGNRFIQQFLALGKPITQLPQVNHRGTFRLGVVFGPFATGTPCCTANSHWQGRSRNADFSSKFAADVDLPSRGSASLKTARGC